MKETMVRQETVAEIAEFGKDHGVIHEMIVTGRKMGAGRNFYSALAHNEELFARTVAFVANGGEDVVREIAVSVPQIAVSVPLSEAEQAAIAILGQGKVLTRAQTKGEAELPIRYSEDTLRACAKENVEQGTDWRLVYLRGNSLRQERERVGINRKRQPCFHNNDWWLSEKEDNWATEKFEAGYYLIDFNGRFGRTSWQNQENVIVQLGPEFERAHEAMVTEAALRIFEATGERLLETWYYWGRSLDS
ncbi:MAG: hypothetical protein G01um10142_429, partial [Parcubacteria group bacterium Gr01-1014_2]